MRACSVQLSMWVFHNWRVTTCDVVVQSRFAETLTVTLTLNPNFGESGRQRHTDVVLIFSTCVCLWPLCNLSLPRNVSRERVTTVWLKFYSRLYCQKEQTSIANIQSYRTRTINLARVWITPYLSVHFDIPFTCGRVGVTRLWLRFCTFTILGYRSINAFVVNFIIQWRALSIRINKFSFRYPLGY